MTEKGILDKRIEVVDSQLKAYEEKIGTLQMQLDRNEHDWTQLKQLDNNLQVQVAKLEEKENIYHRACF